MPLAYNPATMQFTRPYMEYFESIVNGFKALTISAKRSILWPSGIGTCIVCKRHAVLTLLWSLTFEIQNTSRKQHHLNLKLQFSMSSPLSTFQSKTSPPPFSASFNCLILTYRIHFGNCLWVDLNQGPEFCQR